MSDWADNQDNHDHQYKTGTRPAPLRGREEPTMTTVYIDRLPSPLGKLLLVHAGDQLCMLDFEGNELRFDTLLMRRFGNTVIDERAVPGIIHDNLLAYLDGELDALEEIPVHASGTSFQQQVWAKLRHIPPGVTWTYAELAAAVGRPGSQQAVGQANAQNPVSIVVPCHRVIGSDGELTGYAGGLDRKRWLLTHEGFRFADVARRYAQADLFR
jgi:methylated-DNA-[protein]-cysteine S-methyltransferase